MNQVKRRVPVITGIIPDNTEEAITLGLAVRDAGVDALQVTRPPYLFQPGITDLVSYYSEIHERVA